MDRVTDTDVIGAVEAAKVLRISKATVNRRAAAGELPSRKLPGKTGAYVFERSVVEQIAAARDAAPVGGAAS